MQEPPITHSTDTVTSPKRTRAPFIFALCLIITLGRVTLANRSNLYAEDGAQFLQTWLTRPSVFLPFAPYEGYLHLIPRLLSGLVSILPPAYWPVSCMLLAVATVAAVGTLVWESLNNSDLPLLSRFLLAGIPLCLPLASVEPIGNLANLHWFLGYLMTFVAATRIDSKRNGILWALVAILCCLTEIQCALALPIIIVRVIRRQQNSLFIVSGWVLGMSAQMLATVLSSRTESNGQFPSAMAIARGFLTNVVAGSVDSRAEGSAAFIQAVGFTPVVIGLVLYILSCFLIVSFLGREQLWNIIGLTALSMIAWIMAFGLNNGGFTFSRHTPALLRWGTAASMYLLAVGAISIGILAKKVHYRQALEIAVVVVLITVWIPSFRSQLKTTTPTWRPQVSHARQECQEDGISKATLLIEPRGWSITVPCARFH